MGLVKMRASVRMLTHGGSLAGLTLAYIVEMRMYLLMSFRFMKMPMPTNANAT